MPLSRRDFLISSAALVAAVPTSGTVLAKTPVSDITSGSDAAKLDALIDAAVASGQTPGIAVSVWREGVPHYAHSAGMANLETGTRVADASVFRVGSLSKQFTAALVMQLVIDGRLSLSDPAHKYLPFLAAHEAFTIEELLHHTAGVHDGDYDTAGLVSDNHIAQAERIARQQPFFDFAPGSAWLYSNANYILVGAIIEKITGQRLADVAATRLFAPLRLSDTAFDAPADVVRGRASGYTPSEEGGHPFRNAEYIDVALAGGAGAMRSTAIDLCRWHAALFGGSSLPREVAAAMTKPGRLRDGRLASERRFSEHDAPMGDTQYGLGLMLDRATRDGSLIAHHHGGINGFASYLATHVPTGLTLACLCNVDTHPGLPFRDLRRFVFRDVLPPPKG
jgi:D-alanyl-D-alanine carboxypeptidase